MRVDRDGAASSVEQIVTRAERGVDYRADIDGLRAVAIVVVVLYHARVSGFAGGFVGVDVFFVISGWLITQQLLQGSIDRRRVGLLEFWARRIRRLVPASFCMVVGTTLLSLLFLSPLDWRLIALRGVAAALYVSNLLFAARGGDYFSGPLGDSPYLHTWSLGVEEQFYVFWPLVFAGAFLGTRRRSASGFRRNCTMAMTAIFVVSMAINLWLTDAGTSWAFFGLHTRAWEFALAGLVATITFKRSVISTRLAQPCAVVGLVLIGVAVVRFSDATPFPGTAALVPVIGTLLVLVAGHCNADAGGLLTLLRWRPVVILGLWSYSWYLWHWPLMTIAVQVWHRDTVQIRLIAAALALFVAIVSFCTVENPIRYSSSLRRSLRLTYVLGAGFALAAVGVSGVLYAHQRKAIREDPYRTYEEARQSYASVECAQAETDFGVTFCEGGDRDSDRTVVLVGDSHAGQWMTAFSEAASAVGVRAVLRSAGNCSATPLPSGAGSPSAEERRRGCDGFQRATNALIEEVRPAAVVLADANGTKQRVFTGGPDQWRDAVAIQTDELRTAGVQVGLLVDAPASNDPLLCLARGRSESYCTIDHDKAMELVDRFAPSVRALQSGGGIRTFDVSDQICRAGRCRLKADGFWIAGAFEHLTKDFTRLQRPALEQFLRGFLPSADDPPALAH